MSAIILIPTFNEALNLEGLLTKIAALRLDVTMLVIDDNSGDGTGALAEKLAAGDKRIMVMHRAVKEGLGAAYLDGFRFAVEKTDADYIIEMDADLSHNPDDIPLFLEKIKTCDVVIGSRYYAGRISIVNWPLSRLILSYSASRYVRLFSRIGLTDPTSGYKCLRREAVKKLLECRPVSRGYSFQIEVNYILYKMGFRLSEIPIVFRERSKGRSKMQTAFTIVEAILIVWRLKCRTYRHKTSCEHKGKV
ncbi:MAG: polyprenol monophosphomannose synthase [Candidatus Omnitrophica bacterium]|nr:polyprenol monophosphomannose synthase [Candidatus Omnitrophota bacterium]